MCSKGYTQRMIKKKTLLQNSKTSVPQPSSWCNELLNPSCKEYSSRPRRRTLGRTGYPPDAFNRSVGILHKVMKCRQTKQIVYILLFRLKDGSHRDIHPACYSPKKTRAGGKCTCQLLFGSPILNQSQVTELVMPSESAGPEARIESITQTVSQHIETQHGQHNCKPWKECHPGSQPQVRSTAGEDGAPTGYRGLGAHAQKA